MISKIMIRNVATYDNVGVAVENLGKVNFIYGANGCGKTTISNFLNNTEQMKETLRKKLVNQVKRLLFIVVINILEI